MLRLLLWAAILHGSAAKAQGGLTEVTPLIDMLATTVRRMRKGRRPFEPDRTHVHHILLAAGFSQDETLLMIAMLAVQLKLIGIVMYMLHWAAWIQFGVFWLLTGLYFATVEHAWRFGRWLQHQWGRDRQP